MHYVNWWWMGAWMVFWLLLIGAVGYAAVLVAWRHSNRSPESHRPKSA
jgi:hypothetical protein